MLHANMACAVIATIISIAAHVPCPDSRHCHQLPSSWHPSHTPTLTAQLLATLSLRESQQAAVARLQGLAERLRPVITDRLAGKDLAAFAARLDALHLRNSPPLGPDELDALLAAWESPHLGQAASDDTVPAVRKPQAAATRGGHGRAGRGGRGRGRRKARAVSSSSGSGQDSDTEEARHLT
jgi:hypothetical protein